MYRHCGYTKAISELTPQIAGAARLTVMALGLPWPQALLSSMAEGVR